MEKQKPKPISAKTRNKIDNTGLSVSLQKKLEKIFGMIISYIELPEFNKPTFVEKILSDKIQIPIGGSITTSEQKVLFIQMNYARFRLCQLRRRVICRNCWDGQTINELLDVYNYQMDRRSNIINGNMGLVLSLARKSKYPGIDFTDLVSEGSVALLRAVENFDFTKGFKFSTYACSAIFKSFYRVASKRYIYNERFPTQLENTHNADNRDMQINDTWQKDLYEEFEYIFDNNLAHLNDTETSVLKMRFSIGAEIVEPMTLKSVGERLGITKERVRQIQNKAMTKMKPVVAERLVK